MRELRQFDEAVAALLHCRGSPFDLIARIEVADCRWQQGDNDAAWEALEPYVEQPVPRNSRNSICRSRSLWKKTAGRWSRPGFATARTTPKAAVPLLQRVLDFNPRNVEARNLLIANFRRLGRGAEADAADHGRQ